jgi:hypothetical protein
MHGSVPPPDASAGPTPSASPTLDDPFAGIDDRFVPVRFEDLVDAIAADAPKFGRVSGHIRQVAEALELVVALEALGLRRELDGRYAAFNPDRDTVGPAQLGDEAAAPGSPGPADPAADAAAYDQLLARLAYLLDKANYERLDDASIERAIETANSHGMRIRVRAERVERLDLYVRGRGTISRTLRSWRRPIRGVDQTLDVYKRLVVIAHLAGDAPVIIKMFRDIPMSDLEALLPHAEVQMNWFDRAKVFGGGAGALSGVGAKVFQTIVGGAALASNFIWVLIAALFGLSVRSFLGYRRAKGHRESQRTKHLYYQGIASNAAALHSLISTITHEEMKEALLAYAFAASNEAGYADRDALDRDVERWLVQRFRAQVNFDAADGVETIVRWGLVRSERDLRALLPRDAAIKLWDCWSSRQPIHYHRHAFDDWSRRDGAEGVGR